MSEQDRATTRQAIVGLAFAVFTLAACGALMTAAVLAHAPAAVLPLLLITCLVGPVLAASEVARWAPVLRHGREVERELRALDALPETEHPLGL
jgi:hypothetical protein